MSADLADWDTMTGEQRHRWTTVLAHRSAAVPPGAPSVLVDGADGRAALLAATLRDAGRHGRVPRPDEPLAEAPLRGSTGHTGWQLTRYDDPAHRFLAIANRRPVG
jgi:hypothetical protein